MEGLRLSIKCRRVVGGRARGEALISAKPISLFEVDPKNGILKEGGHPLEGKSISGKILLFPSGKGSTAGGYALYEMKRGGTAPLGLVTFRAEPIITAAALIADVPMVDRPDRNPFVAAKDGDEFSLNADRGLLIINQRRKH